MSHFTSWAVALRNLGRNKRRTLVAGCSIILGLAALISLSGFLNYLENFFKVYSIYLNHSGTLSVMKPDAIGNLNIKPAIYAIPKAEQEQILTVTRETFKKDLDFTSKYLDIIGLVGNGCQSFPFEGVGVDPEEESRIRMHPLVQKWTPTSAKLEAGHAFWETHAYSNTILVAPGLARVLNKKKLYDPTLPPMSPVGVINCVDPKARTSLIEGDSNVQLVSRAFDGSLSAVDTDIAGHFMVTTSLVTILGLLAPLPLIQDLANTDAVTRIAVFLPQHINPRTAASLLQKQLKNRNLNFEVIPFNDKRLNPYYVGFTQMMNVMATFFVSLVALTILLSVIDSLSMNILERSKETGTLRCLGYTPEKISYLYFKEALCLCICSLPFGAALGFGITSIVNSLNLTLSPPGISGAIPLFLTPSLQAFFLLCIFFLFITGVTAAIISLRSSHKKIINLMTEVVS